ncbi:MAG: hypothetical protein IJW24_01920 [Clostridia bacterium]|nr:hypothetical protein [Clostridia bacterium]
MYYIIIILLITTANGVSNKASRHCRRVGLKPTTLEEIDEKGRVTERVLVCVVGENKYIHAWKLYASYKVKSTTMWMKYLQIVDKRIVETEETVDVKWYREKAHEWFYWIHFKWI